ncbi:hypothetical protein JQ621_03565 [Bradyrhizobium manausense]|uniref:hypothetical protein n=1 Tax=Bradyrhizobium manausense TaxID=989370 RepID=UPI001BA6550C|nr:hypothetical protein [Bradyrhizobium manausense]MBR1086547.1 hypothetical protein [Bradyrhizobium manausense]
MFIFFGLFADPVSDVLLRISEAWPDLKVVRLEHPISAIAARFGENHYDLSRDKIPTDILLMTERLSSETPSARFLLLRTECFGGICDNRGRILLDGRTLFEAEGDGALRRLIKFWGADIGPEEIFEPLGRSFRWG